MMRIPVASDVDDAPKSEVASLVDIAFLLLIFFLVATTIVPKEQDLALRVPSEGSRVDSPALPLWIEVEGDGSVWWGEGESRMEVGQADEGRDLERLKEMVLSAVQSDGALGTRVVLKVGDEATQQRFTDVLNVLAGAGVETIGMVD